MEEKVRNFFSKIKMDKNFKKAGPGQKLTAPSSSGSSSSSSSSATSKARVPQAASSSSSGGGGGSGSGPGGSRSGPEPSESANRAAAAALARQSDTRHKEVNWSAAAIRAQAQKELEEEQQQNLTALRPPKVQHKEVPPQLTNSGERLLFRCPMIGAQALPRDDLRAEMQKFLEEQLKEEKQLCAAMIMASCNDDKAAGVLSACIEILCKYLTNVVENPDNPKYRKIKRSNKVFQEKVQPIVGAVRFLESVGFANQTLEDGECYLVLDESTDLTLLPTFRDALISAETMEVVLDRNAKVLLPSQSTAACAVPEDFFRVTVDELAREQRSKKREAELRTQLRTQAMREQDAKEEVITYKYALIRIRMPNGLILQGTFDVTEKLSAVVKFLKECLLEELASLQIVLKSGPDTLTSFDSSLEELRLYPAVVLNCIISNAPPSSEFLLPDLIATVAHLQPS